MQRYYTLRSSRLLTLTLFLLCAVSLAGAWSQPLPATASIILTALVLGWGGYHLSLANLRLQHSCVAFRLEEGAGIVLVLRNGRHVPCEMARDSLVTPWLVILNVKLAEQRGARSLVLPPDVMDAQSFRRLRVALKWGDRAVQEA
jgi:toxin CptA